MWCERLTCSSCHNQLKWGPSTALQSSSTLHQSEWARCGEPLWQLSCLASARFWSCHCLHAVLEESRWDARTPKVGQRKTNMDLKKNKKVCFFSFFKLLTTFLHRIQCPNHKGCLILVLKDSLCKRRWFSASHRRGWKGPFGVQWPWG